MILIIHVEAKSPGGLKMLSYLLFLLWRS